jgi:integrase/recombinase XerD
MARKKQRGIYHPKAAPPGVSDPDSIWAFVIRFTRWQAEKNYSHHTIGSREVTLRTFAAWAAERGLVHPGEVTKPILERWQRHLFLHRKDNGEPLSIQTQIAHTNPLKAFFRWMARENYVLYNPAADLELPRIGRRLPKHILTVSEVEKVLAMPVIATPMGIRDRAIMETFYSTGMRRQELLDLIIYDLDIERGTVMIRQGKGDKDRVVPIGERALAWIVKYLEDVRPEYATGADKGIVFLSALGQPISGGWLAQIIHAYIEGARIGKKGSCHIFRHTMATLMLENGADIRFIQAMLGHAELSTTEIYTQVSIKKLKAIHTATHPARPITSADRMSPTGAANADVLIAVLDQEADEEV